MRPARSDSGLYAKRPETLVALVTVFAVSVRDAMPVPGMTQATAILPMKTAPWWKSIGAVLGHQDT